LRKRVYVVAFILIIGTILSGCQLTGEEYIQDNLDKLDSSNPFTRQQGVASLGAALDPSVIEPIANLLEDPEQAVVEQVYRELERFNTINLPVKSTLIKMITEKDQNFAEAALMVLDYLEGDNFTDIVLENIEVISENVEKFESLLVITQLREGMLLDRLWEDNDLRTSQKIILYLDTLGYTPEKEIYATILASLENVEESNEEENAVSTSIHLNEYNTEFILRLLIRDSFNINYEVEEKVIIELAEELTVVSSKSISHDRCEQADIIYEAFPGEVTALTKVFLLDEEDKFRSFYEILLKEELYSIHHKIKDLEYLEGDYRDKVLSFITQNQDLNDETINNLEIDQIMASVYVEAYPKDELLIETGILPVYSNGEFIPELYWQIPKDYRPTEKEQIRYIFSVPPVDGLLICTDRYSGEVIIQQEIGEETNLLEYLEELIKTIE